MSNVLIDAGFVKGLTYAAGAPGFDVSVNAADLSLDTTNVIGGTSSLRITANAANTSVKKYINVENGCISFNFRYEGSAVTTVICQFVNTSANCELQLQSTGKLRFVNGSTNGTTTTNALSASTWYLIEFTFDTSTTTFTQTGALYSAAGSLIETLTTINHTGQTASNCTNVQIGAITTSENLTCNFANVRVTDSSADLPIGVHTSSSTWSLQNQFEGGTNGAAVATNGTTGFGNDVPTAIGGSGVTLSNTQAKRGSFSAAIAEANSGTSAEYIEYGGLGSLTEQTFHRTYFWCPSAYPTQTIAPIACRDSSNNLCGAVRLSTTGHLQCMNAASSTIGTQSSGTLPLSSWVRIELYITPSTTVGAIECKAWWTNPDGTGTPDYDSANTSQVLGANVDRVRFGITTAPSAFTAAWTAYLDDCKSTDIGAPGPSQYIDSGTPTVTTTPGHTTEGKVFTDTGTSQVATTPSGTETRAHTDTGTSLVNTTPSVSGFINLYDDVGKPIVTVTPSSSQQAILVDSGVGGWTQDVIYAGIGPGSFTTLFGGYFNAVPAGSLVMVSISSQALATGGSDVHGNTYTVFDSVIIGSTPQIHHTVLYGIINVACSASDAVSFTLASGCSAAEIVASVYQGVNLTAPFDTGASHHAIASSGSSLTLTNPSPTDQPFEMIYMSWAYTSGVTNPKFDNTYNKRQQATVTANTVAITDKMEHTSSTYSTTLNWTPVGSLHASGIMVMLQMIRLPVLTKSIPSLVENVQDVDAGTSNANTTSSDADIAQFIDAAKPIIATTPSGLAGQFTADSNTMNVTTDCSASFEEYDHNDLGTSFVFTSQPFRQEIVQFADSGTSYVNSTPFGTESIPVLNPCLHVVPSLAWNSTPVGGVLSAKPFVQFATTVRPRWVPTQVGKCSG